ncbi:MAG TPA: acetyl-CoA C-acyltransferase [Clostridiales bacterium]|nr:acetyl-CoA C-acyltransferase [Clostridiales bacterium]
MFNENMVIVSAARTAIGKYGGSLSRSSASETGAIAIREAVARAGLEPSDIDEAVMGCVGTIAEDAYCARLCAIKAGLPAESAALTVNRLCASGLQAIITAAMEIDSGLADICVAGGTENMSNYPFYLRKARWGYGMGHSELEDGLITALSDPFSHEHMGVTAENIAAKYQISRQRQDEFAYKSQAKTKLAIESGLFKEDIVPVTIKISKKEEKVFTEDEFPRFDTSLEKLASLRPAFRPDGSVTAGNSSGINDAAAAVVVMKQAKARDRSIDPLAIIRDAAVAGVEPSLMGTGPIPAVRKLLARTGLDIADIGLIELNEAFAAQSLACIDELGLDENRVNVNGGAIALGHPIGASGCIITIKLISEMRRRGVRFGISTLCIGGGQGLAVLFELP